MAKVTEKKIDVIIPYDGAHNTESVIEQVAESIRRYGIQQPVIIDKNNIIVAGNAIWKAAKSLGMEKVPCIVADKLTDEQIRQYRIADNKTGEFSEWNEQKLRQEVTFINDISDLQFAFDEDLFKKMVVGDAMKSQKPKTSVPTGKAVDYDKLFAAQKKKYTEFTCSCCGRKVIVKHQ